MFFECFDAENAIMEGQCDDATVLIVDPPRKGKLIKVDGGGCCDVNNVNN